MFEILVAFGLDLIFGDPPYPWHPVRVMGQAIERTETWLRARIARERQGGLLLAALIPLGTFVSVWFLVELAFQIHPVLKSLVSIYFLYSALAIKDLEKEARQIYTSLANHKLEEARKNLSRIVGRDTEDLPEEEVIRGTVEAVAESFVDGILAPLFYAALGGAPLALAYKAVNTLDSMVGQRSPRYRVFGRPAAKLDEWANWVPARISWCLIGLGATFVNGRAEEAWRVGMENGASRSSSNSVVPEAAFAGALGVQLGGTNFYRGEKVETPKVGYLMKPLEKNDIRVAYRIATASAWASVTFAIILSWVVQFFWLKIFHPI